MSPRKSRDAGTGGGFWFSAAGDRKRKRMAEYPCVSRLRQRRLLFFLLGHDEFVQTPKAYVPSPLNSSIDLIPSNACVAVDDLPDSDIACRFMGETAVLMDVMHLQDLVHNGQWSDAISYLSRFLPSDRPLGVHGRVLLHFLRVHRAIDDVVTEAKESLPVIAAVTRRSDRSVTRSPALAKLRAIFSSLIESKTLRYHPNQLTELSYVYCFCHLAQTYFIFAGKCRDSVDLVPVRREASSIVHGLVYQTPELKDHMRPCRGSMNPQNILPLGFGHARHAATKSFPYSWALGSVPRYQASTDCQSDICCIFFLLVSVRGATSRNRAARSRHLRLPRFIFRRRRCMYIIDFLGTS
jgi:hypothetical protein